MLPKKNRLTKKDVGILFKKSRSIVSNYFTFKFLWTDDSVVSRISFIAPKSVAKLAVRRNLLRRRGYKILEKYINKFPHSLLAVFIFKKYQDDLSIIENEVKDIFNKIN